MNRIAIPIACLLLGGACSVEDAAGPATTDPTCEGAKCDNAGDRDDPATDDLCEQREADAFRSDHKSFTPTALRWSCADVPEIPYGLRDQEYCESFAIIRPPSLDEPGTLGEPEVLGRIRDEWVDDGTDWALDMSSPYVDLDDEQLDELAALDPDTEVGACVFTSWHSDRETPLPVWDEAKDCDAETGEGCPTLYGVPMDAEHLRMNLGVNSIEAAQNLVGDCLGRQFSIANFDGSPIDDDFRRGCILNELINQTSYRKSDTTVCTAALRLTECNCWPEPNPDTGEEIDFPDLLGALKLRGFMLASWDSRKEPPAGCQYVETGEDDPDTAVYEGSRTLVQCPITAGELLDNHMADFKRYCGDKYADEVVVHVPINPFIVDCAPEDSTSTHAATCPDGPDNDPCEGKNCAWTPAPPDEEPAAGN